MNVFAAALNGAEADYGLLGFLVVALALLAKAYYPKGKGNLSALSAPNLAMLLASHEETVRQLVEGLRGEVRAHNEVSRENTAALHKIVESLIRMNERLEKGYCYYSPIRRAIEE